jgi:hypothetical protein
MESVMKKMTVAVMMAIGLLAGCSDDKFALEAKSGQRGAGSTIQLDGKKGVMTVLALAPEHPDGVEYHVTMKDEGILTTVGNVAGSKLIELHVKEIDRKISFAAIPNQGYVCVDCVWSKLPQNWSATKVQ